MARRHNNWGGSSYGVLTGSNVKSSSPDRTWNRRGPFINLVEGSPAPFSDNRYLLPEYFLDEGECALPDVPFSTNRLQVSPLFVDGDEFVPAAATIVEDDVVALDAPMAAPGAVAAFAADEELTPIIDEGETFAPVVPALRLVAAPDTSDDELSFVIADDDTPAMDAPARSPLLRATDLFAPEDQLTPIVDDEAVSDLLAGRLPTVVDLFAPEDEPSFVTTDDEVFAPAVLWSVPASAEFAEPDEGLSPVGDDETVFEPPLLRLVPADAPIAPEDEAAFPTHDDDSPLALVAPYKLPTADVFFDAGDELAFAISEDDAPEIAIVGRLLRATDLPFADPGELPGTIVPPKPRRHFVPTIGQISTGGGWQLPNGEEEDGGEPDPGVWIGREATFDFEESAPGFVARATQLPIGTVASTLEVRVRATMLDVITVERGNLVYFVAPFTGVPEEVNFSYMAPGSERPIVDSGWPKPNSKIRRIKIDEALAMGFDAQEGFVYYLYAVDTTGMRGGVLRAHFWGTGKHQASAFPEVLIKERPRQLL